MAKCLKSRTFITKYRLFNKMEQGDIDKAVERVMTDPENNQFKRDYLTPYKQEHPTNKQLTLFFKHFNENEKVFFVWINDKSCFHDTRKSHGEDPCIVAFKKLQMSNQLEEFDADFHEGKLEVRPRATDPHFMKFGAMHILSHGNILNDGETLYCMSLVTIDNRAEDHHEVTLYHFDLFLKTLRNYFFTQKQKFEFRIPLFDVDTIQFLTEAHEATEWKVQQDDDLFSLSMI